MNKTNELTAARDIVVRADGDYWQIIMPHAERPNAVFISFVNDQIEAVAVATAMERSLHEQKTQSRNGLISRF